MDCDIGSSDVKYHVYTNHRRDNRIRMRSSMIWVDYAGEQFRNRVVIRHCLQILKWLSCFLLEQILVGTKRGTRLNAYCLTHTTIHLMLKHITCPGVKELNCHVSRWTLQLFPMSVCSRYIYQIVVVVVYFVTTFSFFVFGMYINT
jgi:hypothetical protein